MSNHKVITFNSVLYAICNEIIYTYDAVDCQWVVIEPYHLPDGLGLKNDGFIIHDVEEQGFCSCDLLLLMNQGCQCGGK